MRLPLNPPTLSITREKDPQVWQVVKDSVGESRLTKVVEVRLSPTTKKLLIRLDLCGGQKELESLERPDPVKQTATDTGNAVRGVIVTGTDPSGTYHFLSRYFAPWVGIPEDPVTGSAHTVLAPYWAEQLGTSDTLFARQCSARGGELWVDVDGKGSGGVKVAGKAAIVLEGTLEV